MVATGSDLNVILKKQKCHRSRAMLREVNTERQHFIFPHKSAVCSSYQNMEDK